MKIFQIIPLLPVSLSKVFKPLFPQDLDANFLETRGDLQDLFSIIEVDIKNFDVTKHESQVSRCINAYKFMMSCSNIMSYQEANAISFLEKFEYDYPHLYKTFEVYAWG